MKNVLRHPAARIAATGLGLGVALGIARGLWTAYRERTLELGFSVLAAEGVQASTNRLALLAPAVLLTGWAVAKGIARVRRAPRRPAPFPAPGAGPWAVAAAAVVVLLLVNAAAPALRHGQEREGWNVVLITADTLRADHLGFAGYVRDTSPNLDRLAARGTHFSRAVAQWPKTSPSLASLFTGLYGSQHGVRKTRQSLPREHLVLAEVLRNHAYRTAAVVTNGNLSRGYQFDQGFDDYEEIWRRHPAQDAEQVSDEAVSWLKRHDGSERKFLLWVHYCDPHAYYEPPGRFHEMFVGDGHATGRGHAPLLPGKDDDMGGIPARARLEDRTDTDYYVAQYDAEIRYMDAQIGRVLDTVEDMGVGQRTLVVFTADHGESLGEHDYFFEHGRLPYDPSSRVPLVLAGPGIPAGKEVDHPVELVGVLPTLLELLSLPAHPDVQGRSLLPLLRGAGGDVPELAFAEAGYHPDSQRSVWSSRWKLIYVPDPRDRALMTGETFELYDLRSDPGETRNLVAQETEVAARLQDALFAWMEEIGGRAHPGSLGDEAPDEATQEALRSLGYVH